MTDSDKIFAFVLMPFDTKFDDVYKIGIKEAAEEVGIIVERLDEQMFTEGMMERIYRQIESADLIIADMTGKNANVFYEVGYAHAKDKLCLLITKSAEDIPFDLKHRKHIVYGDSLTYLRDELISNLEWANDVIKNARQSKIRLDVKTEGSLETSTMNAKGFITHTFDLHNDSDEPSPEIELIYYYTGRDWHYKQNNQECPKTNSDLEDYNYRYIFYPPVQRLRPESWAQFQVEGNNILATKLKGDEIKDTYTITGKVLMRFITNKGMYDYDFNLQVELDEFPF